LSYSGLLLDIGSIPLSNYYCSTCGSLGRCMVLSNAKLRFGLVRNSLYCSLLTLVLHSITQKDRQVATL
jgi:hypothetical protein